MPGWSRSRRPDGACVSGASGKPVVQKLGIKPGFRIFTAGAPAAYGDIVGALPAEVTIVTRLGAPVDMIHVFATEAAALGDKLAIYRDAIEPDGMVWVSWPKKSSGVATDLTDQVVREAGLKLGLVDIKVCAIDDTWSALKFVIPRDQRSKRSG
jgi:hypothetical protein